MSDYRSLIVMAPAKDLLPVNSGEPAGGSISMKALAQHLGLSTATISLVINRSPGAKSIPHATQDAFGLPRANSNIAPI